MESSRSFSNIIGKKYGNIMVIGKTLEYSLYELINVLVYFPSKEGIIGNTAKIYDLASEEIEVFLIDIEEAVFDEIERSVLNKIEVSTW